VYLRHFARPFHQNPSTGLVVDRAYEGKGPLRPYGTVKGSCSTSSQPPTKTSRHCTNTRRPKPSAWRPLAEAAVGHRHERYLAQQLSEDYLAPAVR